MNSTINYYEVLECTPSATFDELKRSYQQLVKQFHPDKQTSEVVSTTSDKFLLIDEAWKVLRDSQLRKIYDSSRVQSEVQQHSVIYAEITSDSLRFKDSVAYYQCRCGEHFEIQEKLIKESSRGEEILFECSECSNNLLVTVI